MGRIAWFLCALICACSGDDSHRHTKTPQPAAPTQPAAEAVGATGLSEDAVASYWTTPDELAGAAKFALEDYKAAAEAFGRARAATKDEQRAARLDLILGLCFERIDD